MYLKQAKYLSEILREECAAFGDEVEEILEKIEIEEPKLVALLKGARPDLTKDDIEQPVQNNRLANGNIHTVQKPKKITAHVQIEHQKSNIIEDAEVLSPKTAKSRRKTVAFNFVNESVD